MNRFKLLIYKTTHWEYWPFAVLYFPMFFVWFYYAVKSRTLFFFLPSNPGIPNAGFLLESKKEIYDRIPAGFIPKTLLFSPGVSAVDILQEMKTAGIRFPWIAKPDIGMKGMAVCLLEDEKGLSSYSDKVDFDFLIQEYISLPQEAGVFYYKIPGQPQGQISGITKKEFLTVKGDGRCTVRELLLQQPRYQLQLPALERIYDSKLNEVIQKGERRILVPYGNHARGALFTDITTQVDEKLTTTINAICNSIPGFYFGRLDIRYNSIEELKDGKKFYIIELNGAGSEPTHIYDPAHSLTKAWKEIARHFRLLYEVSRKNHRLGHPHLAAREGLRLISSNNKLVRKLKMFSQKEAAA